MVLEDVGSILETTSLPYRLSGGGQPGWKGLLLRLIQQQKTMQVFERCILRGELLNWELGRGQHI